GELRYIRKEAVTQNLVPGETARSLSAASPPGPPSPAMAAAPETPPPPGGGFALTRGVTQTAAMPPAPGGPAPTTDPLWTEAQEAETAGRLADAEAKYTELGRRLSTEPGKHDLAMQCFNRAYFLRETGRAGPAAAEARYVGQGADSRLRPVAADPYHPPANS